MGRIAFGVCLAVVVATMAARGVEEADGSLPKMSDSRTMRAVYHDVESDEERVFEVPNGHWKLIFAALSPANRDKAPASWESIGRLEIVMKDGGPFHVSLYSVGKGPGAFAAGNTFRERVYYRGGKSDDLVKALRAAYKASMDESGSSLISSRRDHTRPPLLAGDRGHRGAVVLRVLLPGPGRVHRVGHSVEDCLYQARWGMREYVEMMRGHRLPIPPESPDPVVTVRNESRRTVA